ncbi:alpha/beta fold hydrolase [Nocardia sp. NPDC052254]|uniref:alpha/beta hydrolase n=1 Tax=Nocardia sp. NPDC052254 TaxID=3155681 RepID=UPI0034337009
MRFFQGVSGLVHYRVWPVDSPRAVAVLLHGLGQCSADYHRFARALNRCGVAVFGIDQIGHGLSEGQWHEMAPIEDLAANASALTALAAAAHPRLPLVLIGHSLGAGTAVVAMATDIGAATRTARVALLGTPEQLPVQGYSPPAVPTLVLHGADDRRAPIAPIRAWADTAPNCRLIEIADAGHDLLHEPVHRHVTHEIVEFLDPEGDPVSGPPASRPGRGRIAVR